MSDLQKIVKALRDQSDLDCKAGTEHKEANGISAADIKRFSGWTCQDIAKEVKYPYGKWCVGCLLDALHRETK